MKRLLLFLFVAGVAAYMLFPSREEPDWNTDAMIAAAPEDSISEDSISQADRKLRSWGPTLKSLGRDPGTRSATSGHARPSTPLRQEAAYKPGIIQEASSSDQSPGAGEVAAQVATSAPEIDPAGLQVAWVKLRLAASVHSAASVSSPVIKFYGAGRELQVVGREYGWLELRDPVTLERGFVFERYLVAIDGPGSAQPALASTAEPKPARAASPKAGTSNKSSKPTMRASGDKAKMQAAKHAEVPQADRRHDRLAKKEDRRERKLFRWFVGPNAEPAPLTVGSPR